MNGNFFSKAKLIQLNKIVKHVKFWHNKCSFAIVWVIHTIPTFRSDLKMMIQHVSVINEMKQEKEKLIKIEKQREKGERGKQILGQ